MKKTQVLEYLLFKKSHRKTANVFAGIARDPIIKSQCTLRIEVLFVILADDFFLIAFQNVDARKNN